MRTAEIARSLGVPADRVVLSPKPGTATEADCARCERPTELIGGTLVEKPADNFVSRVGFQIAFAIQTSADAAGVDVRLSGPDGSFRTAGGNLRLPSVGVTRAERIRGDVTAAVPDWVPDLAVEVLSLSNTPKEMAEKRAEFFAAGVAEVWEVDPRGRTARVFRDGGLVRTLAENDALEGGEILPGFSAALGETIDAAAAGLVPAAGR